MPPVVAAGIRRLQESGQLRVARGDAVAMIEMAAPGTWVVNATGPDPSLTRSANPVFRQLFADGVARRGPLGIGLDTTASGRLVDRSGFAVPGVWTIGCPRRGQLWESTAIPEIRAQAVPLARCISAADRRRPALSRGARPACVWARPACAKRACPRGGHRWRRGAPSARSSSPARRHSSSLRSASTCSADSTPSAVTVRPERVRQRDQGADYRVILRVATSSPCCRLVMNGPASFSECTGRVRR